MSVRAGPNIIGPSGRNPGDDCLMQMNRYHSTPLLLLVIPAAISLVAGCTTRQPAVATGREKVCIPRADTTAVMNAAHDVLRRMHFDIEKFDIQKGYIRTHPLAGGKFFEFWRGDNVGADNWLLSNLHSIRRTAELAVEQEENRICIDCRVTLQRLSLPQYHATGSALAYAAFRRQAASLQRLGPYARGRHIQWLDLGCDRELACRILERVQAATDTIPNKDKTSGKNVQ